MSAESDAARYAGNVGQEYQNGEHRDQWPAADLESGADDSDAPVLGDVANDVRGAENVDIHNGGARDIDATTVSITQGGARDIDATTVTINQGGAGQVRADEVTVSQGGVGLARADRLTLQQGGTALAVVADEATLDPRATVLLLIAGSTKGDVRPVIDWRAAAAFGASFAVILGLLRRARR